MDGNDENYRWVLEQQQEDAAAIKKQARRYVLGMSSILVPLLGALLKRDILFNSPEEVAKSLIQKGLIGQTGILPPHYLNAFVESMYSTSFFFVALGFGMFVASFNAAYEIEKTPRCQPIGDAEALVNKDYNTVRKWIRNNDEFIESYEKFRSQSIELVKFGLALMIIGAVLYLTLQASIAFYLLILTYSVYYFFSEINSTFSHKSRFVRRMVGVPMVLFLLHRLVLFLQKLPNSPLS